MHGDSTYADAPFNHAKADIILRSSDNIDFCIFKLFLSLASPFFETLFDITQPAEGSDDQKIKDGVIVIPVTEDSKILDALLRFCYPSTLTDDPNIEELSDAMDVLEVAKKYSLDAIEKKVHQAISNPKTLEVAPLECFAIARRGGFEEETLLAAKYTLTQPLIPPWSEGIEFITASDLLSLLTYHHKCGKAVYRLKHNLSWIASHYRSSDACAWLSDERGCIRSGQDPRTINGSRRYTFALRGSTIRPHQWWEDFMEETFTALRDKPCKETVQASAEKTVRAVKARDCPECSAKVTEGMHDFVDLFTGKIEETVSEIELELEFK